jgi:hypothetical protein
MYFRVTNFAELNAFSGKRLLLNIVEYTNFSFYKTDNRTLSFNTANTNVRNLS